MSTLCAKSWLWFHREITRVLRGEARWHVEHHDALVPLRALPDNCIDSCVCDPPAGINFMGRSFDSDRGGRDNWIAWLTEIMREVMRVLKPGAHAFVWALPRTSHWTGVALENAGFEVRDSFDHIFSTGFPKSLNVSKAIDDAAGAERSVVGMRPTHYSDSPSGYGSISGKGGTRSGGLFGEVTGEVTSGRIVTAPGTSEAKQWEGWGTAAKPAHEVWWLVRKPLAGTVAANVLKYGTGAINIDGCRVAHVSPADLKAHEQQVAALKAKGGSLGNSWKNSSDLSGANEVNTAGRWPPNLLFSHHPDCKRIGTASVPANPTWDTPNRATEPSKFTGGEVSKVRHTTRAGEPSADRRYADKGVTGFAALPGERRNDTENVEQWQCVEQCPVRQLNEQAGEVSGGYGEWPNFRRGSTAARFFPQFEPDELDDVVPFLYEAKPARSERDTGLGDFAAVTGGAATGRVDGGAGTRNPRAGAGRTGGIRNVHPTVKSVALMRWLVRLVTPPAGICLDPFAGSGSTGVACILEMVRFLGIELLDTDGEPHVRLARARIAHAVGFDPHAARVLSEDPRTGLKQLSLFALAHRKD
jgi:hypothetical protein